jgi:hypothetical protein
VAVADHVLVVSEDETGESGLRYGWIHSRAARLEARRSYGQASDDAGQSSAAGAGSRLRGVEPTVRPHAVHGTGRHTFAIRATPLSLGSHGCPGVQVTEHVTPLQAQIKEDYILMAEPDHLMLKPIPNLATPNKPAAFPFFYINTKVCRRNPLARGALEDKPAVRKLRTSSTHGGSQAADSSFEFCCGPTPPGQEPRQGGETIQHERKRDRPHRQLAGDHPQGHVRSARQ